MKFSKDQFSFEMKAPSLLIIVACTIRITIALCSYYIHGLYLEHEY